MRIGILGIGAIGGFLASVLDSSDHEIICICRHETCAKIQKSGLNLKSESFLSRNFSPKITYQLDKDIDILLIATKYQYLNDAINLISLKHTHNTLVIPLLNGIGFHDSLTAHFGNQVGLGTIGSIEVEKNDCTILHKSSSMVPKIELAVDKDALKNKLFELADIFRDSGLEVEVLNSQSQVVWGKLLRLNAIASFTAAYQKTIGEIRQDPDNWKEMNDFIKESLLVAAKDGYYGDLKKIIKSIEGLPSNLMTSLQKDVMARKESELDAITGGVIKKGIKNNIDLPIHHLIYNKIKSRLNRT